MDLGDLINGILYTYRLQMVLQYSPQTFQSIIALLDYSNKIVRLAKALFLTVYLHSKTSF